MPFMQCVRDGTCHLGVRADRSYWLATTDELPMMPLDVSKVKHRIARCAICESPSQPFAFHAQANQLEEAQCPQGWNELWHGFSFVMVRFTELSPWFLLRIYHDICHNYCHHYCHYSGSHCHCVYR
ncbi:unnamed protein product [Protopolystoma xenopodis]|uniref:Collagen IV NC1 domain-containing protein n=1 Tax=Protopolystoma xenopodis TaxID=117903 RepID=A0A448WP52_9PLAT|nr:unnamed protein product [Protopolystoma xenopodis]